MLITFLCICPLEKRLFFLKAFFVPGRGESCLGCFKNHSWNWVYAVCKWALFVLVYYWSRDYLMGLLSVTLNHLFCDKYWQLLLLHSCLSCVGFPGKELPMDLPLSCGVASFPSRACIGGFGRGVLLIVKSLTFQQMPWTEPIPVFNIIRVQYSSLISQSYWNQIIK